MQYLDRLKTLPPTEPDNALILGTAVHTGIEQSLQAAIQQYFFSYPIITDKHINEAIKLEQVIPKARAAIPPGGSFEVPIYDRDFVGFIDYLAPTNTVGGIEYYDLYDFKYTANVHSYKDSTQLHLYKYFFERNNPGKKIQALYFLFVPKVKIKQGKTETLQDFRDRLKMELSKAAVQKVQVDFKPEKVIEFLFGIKRVSEAKDFPRNESYLCRFCEFSDFCSKGDTYMIELPKNQRRSIETVQKRVIWIYGRPFCGKTTFANQFPDPLMINTDGNIRYVDAPYIRIRDEVVVQGRQTKKTPAWVMFKDVVAELEKKQNSFRTIVVDLLEDVYEYCRLYMCEEMGISHESDDSFRAWDKVRSEFLNTLKRLMALDYENIVLISHEDTSKDITKKGGDKVTSIKPSLQDKVADKVSGMVDVVGRIVANGDVRTFSFKSNEVIFGGGRLKVKAKDIPLDVQALFEIYDEANRNAAAANKNHVEDTVHTPAEPAEKAPEVPAAVEPENNPAADKTPENEPETPVEEKPPFDGGAEVQQPAENTQTPAEEKPRRKRKVRE